VRDLEGVHVGSFVGIIVITLCAFLFLMIGVFIVKGELGKYDSKYEDKYSFILER
jgi:hypothetical protein